MVFCLAFLASFLFFGGHVQGAWLFWKDSRDPWRRLSIGLKAKKRSGCCYVILCVPCADNACPGAFTGNFGFEVNEHHHDRGKKESWLLCVYRVYIPRVLQSIELRSTENNMHLNGQV